MVPFDEISRIYCQAKVQSQIQVLNPSPKSRSKIQVQNPKSKVQSPEEREWDWGLHYNPTGHQPTHLPITFHTQNVNIMMGKDLP